MLRIVTKQARGEIEYFLNTLYIRKIKKGIRKWQTQQLY